MASHGAAPAGTSSFAYISCPKRSGTAEPTLKYHIPVHFNAQSFWDVVYSSPSNLFGPETIFQLVQELQSLGHNSDLVMAQCRKPSYEPSIYILTLWCSITCDCEHCSAKRAPKIPNQGYSPVPPNPVSTNRISISAQSLPRP